jgi:hypothetical protein
MGAARDAREADPWQMAREFGIEIRSVREAPWVVATTGDMALVAWHPDERVAEARAWDGLARCLLTRSGKRWSDDDASRFAARLKVGALILH